MHLLIEQLLKDAPVVLDGAWGTQLQRRGLPIGAPPDPWNLDRPELVAEVARGYVSCGARIILTNTFGANAVLLDRHGLADRVHEINRAGARISVREAGEGVCVFGSIGPTGKMVSMGEATRDDLERVFAQQVAGLVAGGVHGLVVETMSDIEEVTVAVRAASASGLPVVGCMTYGAGKSGAQTIMGVTPEEAVERLLSAGADVVGANCGQGPAGMTAIVARISAAAGRPVWAKPNAGLPRMVDGQATYSETPEQFVEGALALVAAGAGFIGGCCGTEPRHIAALADAAAALHASHLEAR